MFFFSLACAYGKTFVHQMLLYWKKYEKVEKEHRKRAEKEAMEQRKLDDEFREVLFIYRTTLEMLKLTFIFHFLLVVFQL